MEIAKFLKSFKKESPAPVCARPQPAEPVEPPPSFSLVEYACGQFTLVLPSDHKLPCYQSSNALYDRFLPVLARQLTGQALIVDVGANIGDTLASMASENPRAKYICVEPEPTFFAFLEANTARIADGLQQRPVLLRQFVGQQAVTGQLVSSHGTAKVISTHTSAEIVNSITLEQIINTHAPSSEQRTLLVKSDVDGWDYDVIRSLGPVLDDENLIVYMECQTQTSEQHESYVRFFEELAPKNFHFTIFDNFGNLVIFNGDNQQVISLLDYAWAQEKGIGTRTIWYIDVMISTSHTKILCDAAVHAYHDKYYSTPSQQHQKTTH